MAEAEPRPRFTNHLAGETSPYLLAHAHNPVDWYPWGSEALARARLLDRPVFLSIGYAACHWCHVMERESFEDPGIAAVLNAHFVPVKVDREERPDLDAVYMRAVQALTGSGGWPMSVFTSPDGRPFFGGTYFPPAPRHGLPSFGQLLDGIRYAWAERRADLVASSGHLVAEMASQMTGAPAGDGLPPASLLEDALDALDAGFDAANGGWGTAPKFPQAMAIEALLRRHAATGSTRALDLARRALDAMAAGGIHDQLGGGFHRYSTDASWLVPHFEQMLYDNALLARTYLHAWSATGDVAFRDVATGVLDFLLRDLRTPEGGFAASLDADTDGEEGGTFTWSAAAIRDLLGPDAALFASAYGATDGGNWEGHTILQRIHDDRDLGERYGLDPDDVARRLAEARGRLLAARSLRPQPARDDKVLAAWNGLAIGALADAARSLDADGDPALRAAADRYRRAAVVAGTSVLAGLLAPDGRLRRSWKDGRATADGVLEDHADLADGLLALYEATGDERWFAAAAGLADVMLERFADPAGGFFDTAHDAEALVLRPRDLQDNAMPSGGAMAATVLLRLAALTGDARYRVAAEGAIATVAPFLARWPTAFAHWIGALELAHAGIEEIAVIGDPADPATVALVRVVNRGYRPFTVLAAAGGNGGGGGGRVPLLEGRTALDGRPTAYVCRDFACRRPVQEPNELATLLAGA
ncbi:MAG: thioredoxin domain-containing protein [Chloroflexota bacterium]